MKLYCKILIDGTTDTIIVVGNHVVACTSKDGKIERCPPYKLKKTFLKDHNWTELKAGHYVAINEPSAFKIRGKVDSFYDINKRIGGIGVRIGPTSIPVNDIKTILFFPDKIEYDKVFNHSEETATS